LLAASRPQRILMAFLAKTPRACKACGGEGLFFGLFRINSTKKASCQKRHEAFKINIAATYAPGVRPGTIGHVGLHYSVPNDLSRRISAVKKGGIKPEN